MKQIICIVLLIFSIEGFSQNLLPNGDFEKFDICPTDWTQISYCQNWSSYREDPDYLNSCSITSYLSPPLTNFGFQQPHSGEAYASLVTFVNGVVNRREFLGSPLTMPLIIGEKYYIKFHINLGGDQNATIGSNKIGIKFSTIPYSENNPAPINNYAHFYTDSIVTDTMSWTCLKGSFIADSSYQYLIFGNFFDDNNTDTYNSENSHFAFYFIDDICVSTDSLYCENWLGIKQNENESKELTIYPNPNNGSFEISVESGNVIDKVNIYDSTGRIVYSDKPGHSNVYINLPGLPTGTYYTSVFINEITVHKKLIIIR